MNVFARFAMRVLVGVCCLVFILPGSAQATTLTSFERTAVVKVIAYNDGADSYQYGTGFYLDYGGRCVLTAAHVVTSNGQAFDHVIMSLHAGEANEENYAAILLLAYTDADVAIVCVNDENYPEIFYPYFLSGEATFDQMDVGEDLVAVGYPSFGQDTVTSVFGQLTGFLPLNGAKDILKTDLDISGGISGGPLLDAQKHIVGMMIAKNVGSEGGILSYATSVDFLNSVLTDMADHLVSSAKTAGYAPADCEVVQRNQDLYYTLGETDYYDPFCSEPVNARVESLVAAQYEHWCGAEPTTDQVQSATALLEQADTSLTADDWRQYLTNACGALETDDVYQYYTPDQSLGAVLVKGPDTTAVYAVLADGKRHPFPNTATYASWYGEDFSGVNTLTSEQLAQYSLGKIVVYHPGTLVKIPSIPKVYMVTDEQQLRWVTDETTARTLFGEDWNTKIYDIPESLFPNYSLAEDLSL